MDCDMTNAIRSRLESDWLPKLAALNGCLWEAKAVKEYPEVLQNGQNWNTLSFCLRRYIYLRFTKRRSSAAPTPYEVTFR